MRKARTKNDFPTKICRSKNVRKYTAKRNGERQREQRQNRPGTNCKSILSATAREIADQKRRIACKLHESKKVLKSRTTTKAKKFEELVDF